MTSWEDANRKANEYDQGDWLKLGDGDKAVVAFLGEPFAREVAWNGTHYEPFDPEKHPRGSLRTALNVYNVQLRRVQIFDANLPTFRQILKVRGKYGLDGQLYEISRSGTGRDTEYTVLLEGAADAAQKTAQKTAQLFDLKAKTLGDDSFNPAELEADFENATISAEQAKELIGRAKMLPRVKADAWIHELGVERVSELLAGQYDIADKLLSRLEAEQPARDDFLS